MYTSRLLHHPARSAGFGSFISFSFPFSLSPLVSFLLSRISVSAPYFSGEEDLYNLRGYLPTSVQSLSLSNSFIPSPSFVSLSSCSLIFHPGIPFAALSGLLL